jgi:hypothetical protein
MPVHCTVRRSGEPLVRSVQRQPVSPKPASAVDADRVGHAPGPSVQPSCRSGVLRQFNLVAQLGPLCRWKSRASREADDGGRYRKVQPAS